MKYITIKHLRAHCRVDIGDDDELLELYGDAAEDFVFQSLNIKKWSEVETEEGVIPRSLVAAIMVMAAHLYRCREAVSGLSQNVVPYTFDALIKPYAKLVRDEVPSTDDLVIAAIAEAEGGNDD